MSVSGNANKYCLIESSFPTEKIIPSQISLPIMVSSKGPNFFYPVKKEYLFGAFTTSQFFNHSYVPEFCVSICVGQDWEGMYESPG